jgi:putative thioredoxin
MQPSSFNPYGAVDLAALAAQNAARAKAEEARARAAESGEQPSDTVIDVTEATFQTEVIDRSMTVPVVIDFWAEWCGPCKQLSPILERAALADGGSWVLVKVDTDANPRLQQAFQVQSIPSVFVVWQGQLIPGFTGALPEAQVRQFLDQVIRLASEGPRLAPDGESAAEVDDPLLDAAEAALAANDLDGAAEAFRKKLADNPGDADASAGLATVELLQRVHSLDAEKVRRQAAERPDDVDAQAEAADLDFAGGHVEDAFARLVDTVRRTSGEDRDRARTHLVSLFEVLPPDDARISKARSALANALF